MPNKSTKNILCFGYLCIFCAAASLALSIPTLHIPENRYSFACVFCAVLFGGLTALSGHMGRDFRRLQGACLVIGGAIWVAFSIRPSFIWLSAIFGLMMTLAGLSLFLFKSRAFTGYLGLVYSVVCALMLMMSGIGLYVARKTPFSELSYLLQSFLAFCAFCSCGIVCFLESRRQRS